MINEEIESRRSRMAKELDTAIKVHRRGGQRHYFSTIGLALAATVSSFIAGILAFAEADKTLVGICAFIPAAATILIGTLKLQEKERWYYDKKNALLCLHNELHYELPIPPDVESVKAISQKWSALNMATQGDWSTKLSLSLEDLRRAAESARGRGQVEPGGRPPG